MKFSRVDPKQLIASLAIAVGVVLLFVALDSAQTNDELAPLPEAIESIDPVLGASQVLSQGKVFVDLQSGYTGVLIVNGLELPVVDISELAAAAKPGQQISLPPATVYEPGNATLSFQPSEGAPIEAFDTGLNSAVVRYWKVVEGTGKAKSFSWTFTVI